jgi:hypothetical protein
MNHPRFFASLLSLILVAPPATAGTWTFTNLFGGDDLETGIDATKTYTHLIDFGADATPATINGVVFTAKGMTGPNYSLAGTGGSFIDNGQGAFAGTGIGDLFSDFYFGGAADGIQTLTLTGLREAHVYRLSFFVSGWGTPAVDIVASDAPEVTTRMARDGTNWVPDFSFPDASESTSAGNPGAIISYDYVAPANGTLVLVMNALSDGDTFHHYGLVNEQIGIPGDSDTDGMPDIYEQANGLNPSVNDAALDLDTDGVVNLTEYINGTKANNPDTDADGLSDGVESNTGTFVSAANTGTNPLNPDTDGDGLQDGAETNTGTFVNAASPGSHPLRADTDADGFNDGFEAQQAFDPNVATSTPESSVTIRTAVEFRFNAANGVSYRIEGSSDLEEWTTVEPNIAGAGARVTRFYSTENTPLRFYRAERN